jgi:hypothetical protein
LIDGTAELVAEVRCDDHTLEDLIGMLTEPTHCGLWIMWRGFQCDVTLGLVHPEETTLQTVSIHKDFVVVEVITVYTIFADELLEYPPNDEVMKLGQAQGQNYSGEGVGLTSKEHQHVNLVHRLRYRFLVVHIVRYRFLPQMVPLLCTFLRWFPSSVPSSDGSPPPPPHLPQSPHPQDVPFGPLLILKKLHAHLLIILKTQKNLHPHIRKVHKIFHPHLLLILKNRKTCIPTSARDTKYSIPTTMPTTTSSSSS